MASAETTTPTPLSASPSTTAAKPHTALSSSHHQLAAKFLFAGMSNMIGSFVTNPVDIVKVRLQLQGEGVRNAANQNFARLALTMFKNEGSLSFYNGVTASMLREATYSTIRLGAYDWFKSLVFRVSGGLLDEKALITKITAGLASGMTGAAIANPTDLVKVRMQAYNPSPTPRYRSVFSAFPDIYRTEGLSGLYRGVGPTMIRAALVTASQLATYDHAKHWLIGQGIREGLPAHFASSVIAGLACSITSAPVDTIKVRYMNQPFDAVTGRGLVYTSSFDCLRKTIMLEGPLALYKGFFMCWLRLGPQTIVSLIIFEQLRRISGINPSLPVVDLTSSWFCEITKKGTLGGLV
ncbi:mitochondrial substrate carrier family protein ucpB [Endogone sp. FLAS-F59071]|nr:mitochondrial substrate carrier family protein ucpB [Endogone sp. FLAS-F59071]|eukprot:RUS14667.1 mitochondrial substrate carrier family protein ucpB [Endogone sp. FLAS-F59071]